MHADTPPQTGGIAPGAVWRSAVLPGRGQRLQLAGLFILGVYVANLFDLAGAASENTVRETTLGPISPGSAGGDGATDGDRASADQLELLAIAGIG